MKKRRKWAKYDFSESPPNYYTGVRIPTKIQKDILAFFEEFLKNGPFFFKVNQIFENGFRDSVISREGVRHP